jgi:hypothetical protein
MSNITTCSKAKSTDKRSLTDSEMVKEVYATDDTKTSEPATSSNRPNKIRNIEKEDDPNAMVIELTEITAPSNSNEQSRDEENGSTNEPMETDKEIISNLEDHQNTTNPQKGKEKETLQIEQLDYNELDAQNSASPTYPVFIARDQFPGQENNFEIRKKIRDAFSNHFNDIINIRWEKHQYLIVFIIEFS